MTYSNSWKKGFSLVEMAIVLVIVGLIISALLTPLTVQLDQSRNAEARRDIMDIKDALLGFAMANSRLPCPDTDGDGEENVCLNTNVSDTSAGNVPWALLGLKSTDPWGRIYQYRVNNGFSTTFTLATTPSGPGVIQVCKDNTCAIREASNVPAIIFSYGKNGGTLPPVGLDEQENANGDRTYVNHDFSNGANEFDDLLAWISSPVLMSRMVTVGKLP